MDLHIVVGHVEHIDKDGLVAFCVGPGFVGKDLNIANAVEIEDARAVSIDVVRDHEVVFGPHIVGFDQAVFYPTAVVGGVTVEDGAALLGIGLLQEGDGCSAILVGEHLAVEHLQAELFWHDARLGIDAEIGRAVKFDDPIGMGIDMDGYDFVVVERFGAEIRQGVDTKMFLGGILHIAHIGIDSGRLKILHVVVDAYHVTLIVDAEIEGAACGGVEEGTDGLHDVGILGKLIGLHVIVGGIDHGGLELLGAALNTEIGAAIGFKVGICLCLEREGADDFAMDHVAG